MTDYSKYSVLMSIYYKESAENFKQCLESVFKQTILPNEVIVVRDGELNLDLEEVIKEYSENYSNFFVYGLEKNSGLGVALNYGLHYCNNEVILRMDTDDIAIPTRAEKQINYLINNSDVSVVGSYVDEFVDDPSKPEYVKKVPLSHEEIVNQLKRKNPINHPSVAFKKSAVLDTQGYIELKYNEDYFLWLRMMEKGYKFSNISESLVKMRVNDETYIRRGGYQYFKTQNIIYKYMFKNKIINNKEYISGYLVRFVFRVVLPNKLRKVVSKKLLRRKVR